MPITAADVKKLRDATAAGMMDCKKALEEANGDFQTAVDWLRKKGLASAANKSGRIASEGLVAAAVAADRRSGVLFEVNCETDFVARGEAFAAVTKKLGAWLSGLDLTEGFHDGDSLNGAPFDGATVAERLAEVTAQTGERTTLRRVYVLKAGTNAGTLVTGYVHQGSRIGVLTRLTSGKAETAARGDVQELGLNLALQAASMRPVAIRPADVPDDAVAREKAIYAEQAASSGKPAAVIEKMVEGKLRKWFEEVTLLEQFYVLDMEKKPQVKQVVADTAKAAGDTIDVTGLARFELGEGLEKRSTDLAGEVAKIVAG